MSEYSRRILKVLTGCLLAVFAYAAVAALDDPTRPPGYKLVLPQAKRTKAAAGWYVNTIRISARQRMAVINGRRVTEGDRVNGAVVVEILPTRVRLRHRNKDVSIKLFAGNIRKRTSATGQ